MTIEKSTVAIGIGSLALTISLVTLFISSTGNQHRPMKNKQPAGHHQMAQAIQAHNIHKFLELHQKLEKDHKQKERRHKKFNPERLEKKFDLIDANKDGNISKEEWMSQTKQKKCKKQLHKEKA